MPRYLVQNNRARRVEQLFGRTLASRTSGGVGTMWLTDEQFVSPVVQKRLQSQRLVVIREERTVSETLALTDSAAPEPAKAAPEPAKAESEVKKLDAAPDPELGTWTVASLKPRPYRDNQRLAKAYRLKSSGPEDDIIARLLKHQGEVSDAS